jgi:6-phosphogluconolactonase
MRMTLMLLAALPLAQPVSSQEPPGSKSYWVFIGTYTGGKSKGIYRAAFDAKTGEIGTPELAAEMTHPSFLAFHPTLKFLYAVSETGDRTASGMVHAFRLDAQTGQLTPINAAPSHGGAPCHLVVDRAGKNVLVANYSGGTAAMLRLRDDGGLSDQAAVVRYSGKSVNPTRQEAPHAHSINLDPTNKIAVVADLGLDQLHIHDYDPDVLVLKPLNRFVKSADGAGPRHFAFHPTEPWAYSINELDCTVDVLHYDRDGRFQIVQTISTLPGRFQPGYSTAEVQVHPSGHFVYGSNRGHNTIVGFRIDRTNGKLSLIGHEGESIKTPRNFGIDPTGRWMIVGSQDGDQVVVYAIDVETGKLTPTGKKATVGAPVCIKFVPKP